MHNILQFYKKCDLKFAQLKQVKFDVTKSQDQQLTFKTYVDCSTHFSAYFHMLIVKELGLIVNHKISKESLHILSDWQQNYATKIEKSLHLLIYLMIKT